MCEGPNELAIIEMLLENDKLCFTTDDLLDLRPFHARQIEKSTVVQTALNMYNGPEKIRILRIGDKMSDALKIPPDYKDKIESVEKYCTKPELEMLLIIAEGLQNKFEKVKSKDSPKNFSKENIYLNKQKYNNSTKFFRDYFGDDIDKLVNAIEKYKSSHGAHKKDEGYLADLLK